MNAAEAILRVGTGLGAIVITIAILHFGVKARDQYGDLGEGVGWMLIGAGLVALTLALGAVAGPEAVRAFWG